MKLICSSIYIFFILTSVCMASDSQTEIEVPPLETFILEPTIIENISIWVPAAKSGPCINQSCQVKQNLTSSSALPAVVKHQKTNSCPDSIARILAELTSFYHSQSLPLTIFNGWQWEYSYSISQFESVSYNLADHGGCWENAWDAIVNLSYGATQLHQLYIDSLIKYRLSQSNPIESKIEVKTFSSMRTRDGYPKERKIQN